MNIAGDPTQNYMRELALVSAHNKARLQFLRIALPQSVLTPHQLTSLARMIQRCSPRYGLRLRNATELEIATFSAYQPWIPELLLRPHFAPARPSGLEPMTVAYSTVRVHVPGAHLRVRQLRVLAALMQNEGLPTVRIADSETLVVEHAGRGREAVLRLGLREAGLISV